MRMRSWSPPARRLRHSWAAACPAPTMMTSLLMAHRFNHPHYAPPAHAGASSGTLRAAAACASWIGGPPGIVLAAGLVRPDLDLECADRRTIDPQQVAGLHLRDPVRR